MASSASGQYQYFASNYRGVPWEDEAPEYVWMHSALLLRALGQVKPASVAAKLLEEHVEHSAACSIYFSNLVEEKGASLPATMQLVNGVLHGANLAGMDLGSEGRESCREVTQHAAAYSYLHDQVVLSKQQLSESVVLEAHNILMANMKREDGLQVQAGAYRTGEASAGYHHFPPAFSVRPALVWMLEQYNQRVQDLEEDPFVLSAWLSYEFVTIHPFDDGNGRMCRLLLSMVLLSRGVPFCSALGFASGHRRAKQHYMQCIKDAREHNGVARRLAFVVLCSFRSAATSYFEALRMSAPDEYPSELKTW